MSEEPRESNPSLVGTSVRSVDNDHYETSIASSRSPSKSNVKGSTKTKTDYTTVNELVDEGVLVNDEQEYDALLDDAGNVKKDVSRDNVIIIADDKDKEHELERQDFPEPKDKEPELEDVSQNLDDQEVGEVPNPVDNVKIDESTLKEFVVVDIEKEEPDLHPNIYELKNNDSNATMSLEDLIDSQIATISDFSADLKKKVTTKRKPTDKKTRKRSNSGVLPDSVIENDAAQQVPAGAPEGVYSPLVQSREQSKARGSGNTAASIDKPHLARGDSYTGNTVEFRTGRTSTRDEPLKHLNQSSRDYLRSVSRSRSRISQEIPAPTQKELEDEGALINDPEYNAELENAQNNVIEHVDLQKEVLKEVDEAEEDVPSEAEVSQLLKQVKEAPVKKTVDKEKGSESKVNFKGPQVTPIEAKKEVNEPKAEPDKDSSKESESNEEIKAPLENEPEFIAETLEDQAQPEAINKELKRIPIEESKEGEPKHDLEEEKSSSEDLKDTSRAINVEEPTHAEDEVRIHISDGNEVESKTQVEEDEKIANQAGSLESEGTTRHDTDIENLDSGKADAEENKGTEEHDTKQAEVEDETGNESSEVATNAKSKNKPVAEDSEEQAETDKDAETSKGCDADIKELSEKTSALRIDNAANKAERLIEELEREIGGVKSEHETDIKDIKVDEGEINEEEEVPVKIKEDDELEANKVVEEDEKESLEATQKSKALEAKESNGEKKNLDQDKEEEEELHEPTKEEIIELLKDEPVYIYTSLAGGGFHMPTRTNKLATILTANRVPFTYRDLGTDDEARNVWRRYSKGRLLPAVVRGKDDIIGNWEEIEEANEDYRVRELIYETL